MLTIDDVAEEILAILKDIRENESNFFHECQVISAPLLTQVKEGICSYLTENNLNISQEGGWENIDAFLQRMVYHISDNKQLYFFKLCYAQESSLLGKVRLRLIKQCPKEQKQKTIRELTAHQACSVIDLEVQSQKVEIERWLHDKARFEAIKKHFEQNGILQLPKDIIDGLANLAGKKYSNKTILLTLPSDTKIDSEVKSLKDIFGNPKYQFFLNKICELKIKEIAFYLAADDYSAPSTKVYLSVLMVDDHDGAGVITANIKFDDKSQLAIGFNLQQTSGTLVQCLMSARWEMGSSDVTLLRFSNVIIEQFVEVKMKFGNIKYAIASDILKLKKQKDRNFWEGLVFKRTLKSLDEQAKAFLNDFNDSYNRVLGIKSIDVKDVAQYAKNELAKEINQSFNVQQILHNQRATHGTLLYLPTAYGKTYVILLAIYQYWVNHGRRPDAEPFLVVGPLSVASVWRKSANDLDQISKGKISYKMEDFDQKETLEENDTPCPTLRFITTETLHRQLKHYTLIPEEIIRRGKFAEIFGSGPEYYLMLGLIKSLNLLVRADGKRIFSVAPIQKEKNKNNMYVLYGDESVWKQVLGDIINQKDNVSKKIIQLQKKIEILAELAPGDFNQFFNGKDAQHQQLLDIEEENKKLLFKEFEKLFSIIKDDNLNFAISRLFYLISAVFYLPNVDSLTEHESIRGLQALRIYQEECLTELNKYRTSFSGIILDESDIVLKNSSDSITNWLIFNIAKHCQRGDFAEQKRSGLIIASSATPWPNNIDEFLDHIRFLAPSLIDRYFDLPPRFSKEWKRLERHFDQKDKKESINSQAIAKFISSANYAVQCLFDWKEQILNRLMCYVSSAASVTNNSSKFLFETDCNDHIYQFLMEKDQADDKEFPPVSEFYAKCLNVKKNPEVESELAIQSGSNMLEKILALLGITPGEVLNTNKVACYVDRYEVAGFLAKQFVELCKVDGFNILISYFFAENISVFGHDEAQDRQAQLNAFNNVITFEDIESHILNSLKKSKTNFFTRLEKRLQNVILNTVKKIQASEKPNSSKRGRQLKISKQKQVRLFLKYAKKGRHELCYGVSPELVNFFIDLNKLATQSQNEIVVSYGELIFPMWNKVKALMEVDSLSDLLMQISEGGEMFVKSRAVSSEPQALFIDLIRLTFSYLDKITRSNLLIFGPAGASGIRIDADKLFILSGAWTLGRLSQIEGRVGRAKPNHLSSKPCEIYLPMTNTIFEFYILKCYVKKALLNEFLMSKQSSLGHLIEPLLIVNQLKAVYKERKKNKQTFFLTDEHIKVSNDDKPIGQRYVDMEPLEKSKQLLNMVKFSLTNERQEVISKFYSNALPTLNEPISQRPSLAQSGPTEPQPPKLPINNRELTTLSSSAHQNSQHSIHPPLMRALFNNFLNQSELDLLKTFVARNSHFIILCVPTRSYGDDLSMDDFVRYISASTSTHSVGVIIVFGINQCESKRTIILDDFKEKRADAFIADHVFVKPFHFVWRDSDRSPRALPPIGQMRNFCLEKAKYLFESISSYKQELSDIFFMSMDGDTQLTKDSFNYVFEKVKLPNRNVMVTGGYELFIQNASLNNDEIKFHAWLDHLELIAQRFSQLSLNVYASCYTNAIFNTNEQFKHYYGYFAEPLIMLSAPLSKTLLQVTSSYSKYKSDYEAPYGFWDMEGRRLRQFLLHLTRKNVDIYGPSANFKQRPLLMNTKKFSSRIQPIQYKAVEMSMSPPIPPKSRLILDQRSLITVIQRMCAQSQHCINPYFMGSNIASFMKKPLGIVRKFASYFYLRAFVELLNLGPKRSDNLINLIYGNVKDKQNFSEKDLMNFGPKEQHQAIKEFIVKYFIEGLVNLPGSEKIENRTEVIVLILLWARHIALQLRSFFQDYFVEELEPNNQFKQMSLPARYPLSAIDLSKSDNTSESDCDDDENELSKDSLRQSEPAAVNDHHFLHPIQSSILKGMTQEGKDDQLLFQRYGLFENEKENTEVKAKLFEKFFKNYEIILGEALGRGESFFDAAAQAFNEKHALYTDGDITTLLEIKIKSLGGYASGCHYILSGSTDEKYPDEDTHLYYVAVTPAIDTCEQALPIDYFIDKTKQNRNSLAEWFEKLLPALDELKITCGTPLFKVRLNELIGSIISQNDTEKIFNQMEAELKNLDFSQDKIQSRIQQLDIVGDKRDVFDEIKPILSTTGENHIKILSPYNISQVHWLTAEIKIHKKDSLYKIEITAHDPYGEGEVSLNNFHQLCETVKKQIKSIDRIAVIKFENVKSAYSPRQQKGDGNSCGVIVVEDLIKRINGQALQQPQPYPVGAGKLRQEQIEHVKSLPEADETRQGFLKRHSSTIKSLRLLCYDYLKINSENNNWVKELIEAEGGNYQYYLERLAYTAEEMEKNNRNKTLIGTHTIGKPTIEGRIICEKLGIKIHVIEIREELGSAYKASLTHHIVSAEESFIVEEKDLSDIDDNYIHLAVANLHYVPILRKSCANIIANIDNSFFPSQHTDKSVMPNKKNVTEIFVAISKEITTQYYAAKSKVEIKCQYKKLFYIKKTRLNVLLLSQEADIEKDVWKFIMQKEISRGHETDAWITVTVVLKNDDYFICCYNQKCDEIGSKVISTIQESLNYLRSILDSFAATNTPKPILTSKGVGDKKRTVSSVAVLNNDTKQPKPSGKKAKAKAKAKEPSTSRSGESTKIKPAPHSGTLSITKYFPLRSSPEKKEDEPKQPSGLTTSPLQTSDVVKSTMASLTPLPKLSDKPFTMFRSSTKSSQISDNPSGLASTDHQQTNSSLNKRKPAIESNEGAINSSKKAPAVPIKGKMTR